MFESEHYTSISALASIGGAMVGNGVIVARAWVWCHNLLHTLHAIKTGSGSRNEAARVGNEVVYSYGQIATSLVPRPSHM